MYEFGKFVLDPNERVLFADGNPIQLTDKVFETLLLLVQQNGRLLTKNEMIESIWEGTFVEESNLAKNVSRLRKILNTGDEQLIETLPRRGYRFLAEVKELSGETSLLVHRRMRVTITKTTDDADQPKEITQPHALALPAAKPRSKMPWVIAALALVLFGIFLVYNFPIPYKPAKSGGLTNLTNDRGDDLMPSWSPDGSKIAFTSNRAGTSDVYVMNADGTGVTRLTYSGGTETAPVWSPDGSKIVMDSDRDGNREIYSMNADGSKQTRLTFNPTSDCGPVSFSPDGERIAFARNASGEGPASDNFDIYSINIDGGDLRQLTTDPRFDAEPVWSPDGSRILFITGRDRNFEIYAIKTDGTGEVNLTNSPAYEGAFAFAADGMQVFYLGIKFERSELSQIYLMNIDGTDRRQLTSFSDKIDRAAYSPQAMQFSLTSKKDGNFEIYAMDAANVPLN